jgi:hypothetical protein
MASLLLNRDEGSRNPTLPGVLQPRRGTLGHDAVALGSGARRPGVSFADIGAATGFESTYRCITPVQTSRTRVIAMATFRESDRVGLVAAARRRARRDAGRLSASPNLGAQVRRYRPPARTDIDVRVLVDNGRFLLRIEKWPVVRRPLQSRVTTMRPALHGSAAGPELRTATRRSCSRAIRSTHPLNVRLSSRYRCPPEG